MSIAANIEKIKQQLSQNIKLIAVSKTKPVETLMEAYNSGQKIFGENNFVADICVVTCRSASLC